MKVQENNHFVNIKVFRYNPLIDAEPTYKEYQVPFTEYMTVLMALKYINEKLGAGVSFRSECENGFCGSCAIMVNGVPAQSCRRIIQKSESQLVLEPLRGYPIIKDLVVNFKKIEEQKARFRLFHESIVKPIDKITTTPIPNFQEFLSIWKEVHHCVECYACTSGCPLVDCPSSVFSGPYFFLKLAEYSLHPENIGDITMRAFVEGVYQCTLCGLCKEICFNKLDIPRAVIENFRSKCIEKGLIKIPAYRNALESLYKYGNLFGVSKKEDKLKWIEDLNFEIKRIPKHKANVLLYIGSMYALEPTVSGTIKSIVRVLKMANVDFGIMEDERDDGLLAIQLGDKGLFEELAEQNIKIFNNLGIKTLVTPDPHAYNSFKNYYPRVGKLEVEVLHITEYVEKLINDGSITPGKLSEKVVTYHDPCNLGRFSGIYEAPRNLINAIKGVKLKEMKYSKNYARCCGAGGGVMIAYPELMTLIARKRIEDVESTGASILITACPWCEYAFKVSLGSQSRFKVQNIIEFVESSLKV